MEHVVRRICILVTVGADVDASFLSAGQNPGIGGSEFAAFRLARLLGEQHPEREVLLVTNRPATQFAESADSNIGFEQWAQWSASSRDCVIVTNSQFRNPEIIEAVKDAGRVIGWSHHPFDMSLRHHRLARMDAIVSPGVFSLASNRLIGFSGIHIPYYILPREDAPPRALEPGEAVNYVFMSSGLAIKGFWDMIDIWQEIRGSIAQSRLHIIGNTPVVLPIEGGPRAASMVAADLASGRIVLHGPVGFGKAELFRDMHIGIVNPRGLSESFVLTAFEMLACGVPIVSSSRQGMYESMRHFPESRGITVRGIARKAIDLGCDPALHSALSARAKPVIDELHAMGPEIASRWLRLADDEDLRATRRELQPMWPLERKAVRLLAGIGSLLHYRLRLKRRWRRYAEA
jgi:glycosyltransferase involved in cell wall biosynthesis